ncbi:MAG: AAA family ATPase [Cyanophyceae cyanobacterium]
MVLTLAGYEETDILYAGTQTLVYRATCLSENQPVIVKALRNPHPELDELVQFRNQYAITSALDSPYVVRSLGLEPYGNCYALVMPDDGAISLSDYWPQAKQTSQEFLAIALQMAAALQYLGEQRIIHKDIKPANTIIHPGTQQVQLIDFSISSQLPKQQQQLVSPNVLEGTLPYISPEQTGRMNRSIDYRSDYYSLGVMFFELLTGQLPFESRDPMELVHCHIAVAPPVVHEVNPSVPRFLSDIVAKLMQKNAEDRYQSAAGILHDLDLGAQRLQTADSPAVLELGLQDITEHFLIPEKLYGRDAEVALLLDSFDRVAGDPDRPNAAPSGSEFLLVAGFSGIGKTSVINEVHKPIVQQRGYFIEGKFDQFQQNVPYSAIVSAFRALVQQLLSEGEAQFQQWCEKLQGALGEDAQVIVEVIPEVELLIGPQPPVPQLGPTETQLRFNRMFGQFMRVFCSAEHPLVIFLDDLQWADAGTLNLIEVMLSDRTLTALMLIGAYRDNEVSPAHPLVRLLDRLRRTGVKLNEIFLQPLSRSHLGDLIADTLYGDRQRIMPLVELVHKKTGGNPFFANECLKALHQEGLLQFDPATRIWEWDIKQIEARGITDDVVELMVGKLRRLPDAAQHILSLAACIGARFDLTTLSIVAQQSRVQVHRHLAKALQLGFIYPTAKLDPDLLIQSYRFGHDRIQQAAYALIPVEQRQQMHLEIGRSLLQDLSKAKQHERCFEIADHLNQSLTLIHDSAERLQLARLDLDAAEKAKTSLAYSAALSYVSMGTSLIDDGAWQQEPALAMKLYRARVDIEYLCGHFETALTWVEAALEKASTELEKADIYTQQMVLYILSGDYDLGIETAYKAFAALNITVPLDNPAAEAQRLRDQIDTHLQGQQIDSLMALPMMIDPAKKLALKLLDELLPSTYVAKPELFAWVINQAVVYTIDYGLHPSSCHCFSCYGMLLVFEENYADAYAFGSIALQLAQQWNEHLQISRTAHVLSAFLMGWSKPVEQSDPIQKLVKSDLTYMGYSYAECFGNKFLAGWSVERLVAETKTIDRELAVFENKYTEVINGVFKFALDQLQDRSPQTIDCDGQAWSEADFIQECLQQNWVAGLCTHHILQAFVAYLNEDYELAYELSRRAEEDILTRRAGMIVPLFYLYHCLILAANYDDRPEEQPEILAELERCQQQLQRWRKSCPDNFEHIYQLVMAEINRLNQRGMDAIAGYDAAIASARSQGFGHHEAIANECAAKFWIQRQKPGFAQIHLIRAWYGYQEWGAIAKTQQLQRCYGTLLSPISDTTPQQQPDLLTESLNFAMTLSPTTGGSSTTANLDTLSILQASQTLSSEIELDTLLANLLKLVIETAGADYCALLLHEEDELFVGATLQAGEPPRLMQMAPFEASDAVPNGLIRQVQRSQNPQVVSLVQQDSTLLQDPYIQTHQPQSLLGMPLLNQLSIRHKSA